jgi:hypothetical protein
MVALDRCGALLNTPSSLASQTPVAILCRSLSFGIEKNLNVRELCDLHPVTARFCQRLHALHLVPSLDMLEFGVT